MQYLIYILSNQEVTEKPINIHDRKNNEYLLQYMVLLMLSFILVKYIFDASLIYCGLFSKSQKEIVNGLNIIDIISYGQELKKIREWHWYPRKHSLF